MRGATIVIVAASLAACSVTTTHVEPPPPVSEQTTPTPTEPQPDELPAINGDQIGVWESRPRIAGGDEAPERYILGSDGRFVWQAADHADPEATADATEGYEKLGRWGSGEQGIVLREERRLVSQLTFVECPNGEEQCECNDCACEACTDAEAEGDCPCARQSSQQMQQPPTDITLAVGECPADVLERVAAEQNEQVQAPCHMLGDTPFWQYADSDEADLRVQDAWGSSAIQ